jgi:hypothetical protein
MMPRAMRPCILRLGVMLQAAMLPVALALCLSLPATPQALRVRQKPLRPRPDLVCVLCYLTVNVTPGNVNFALVQGGVSNGSSAVAITTTMYGITLFSSVSLYAYFGSSTAALTDGATVPDNIPSSAVLGQMTTGKPTVFTAFTQSNVLGTAGAGLLLFTAPSLPTTGCVLLTSCRTDNLGLEIDLTSLPQLPAGNYNGTLILQAQVL